MIHYRAIRANFSLKKKKRLSSSLKKVNKVSLIINKDPCKIGKKSLLSPSLLVPMAMAYGKFCLGYLTDFKLN